MLKQHFLGIMALLIGAGALTMGILAEYERDRLDDLRKQHQRSEGITIRIKKHAITFGKKKASDAPPPESPEYPPFQIAAWATGVLGLVLAPLSWMRERQKVLCFSAAALCIAGLAWHYVLIAISAVVILLLLMLLAC